MNVISKSLVEKGSVMKKLLVVAPKAKFVKEIGIALKSGIVAEQTEQTVRVYYEGNTIGAANLVDYEDRLLVAAARLINKAPTTAYEVYPVKVFNELFDVFGEYDHEAKNLHVSEYGTFYQWVNGKVKGCECSNCDNKAGCKGERYAG